MSPGDRPGNYFAADRVFPVELASSIH
jgi:hypothetical protein